MGLHRCFPAHCNWADSFTTKPAPPPICSSTRGHTHARAHTHHTQFFIPSSTLFPTLEMYALMPSASLMHGSPKSWASWSGMSWSLSRAFSRLRHFSSSVTPWLRTYKTNTEPDNKEDVSMYCSKGLKIAWNDVPCDLKLAVSAHEVSDSLPFSDTE